MPGPSTQTSTSTTTPLSPQVQPTLDKLLGGVQAVYDKGPSVYPNSLYVPSGTTTRQGQNALIQASQNPGYAAGVNAGLGFNNDLISGGGLTGPMSGAIDLTRDATGTYRDLAGAGGLTDAMRGNIGAVGNIGQGYAGLADAFSQDAPGYQTLRQNLMDDAVKNVGEGFIGSGRFGGKSYIDTATKSAVNAIAPLDYQNFQNDVNNRYNALGGQLSAANTAFGMGQQGLGNQLSALGGQLAGAGQGFNMGQQGVANAFGAQNQLGALYQALTAPGQTLGQVGAAQDADLNAQRQGEYDLWERDHNAQTDLLAKLSSILAGNAGAGGSQTVGTQPGPSPLQTFGSLALGGLALL